MKKLGLIVVTLLVAAAASSWAQTNAFTASVKGSITKHDGTIVKVGDVSKGVSDLILTSSNVLAVIVDETSRAITLAEVDPATTNLVRTIADTFSFASTAKGKFNTDLETSPTVVFNTLPPFDGDLQADGSAKVKNDVLTGISAKLTGVWFDPDLSSTNLPEAVFKGTLKSTGTLTVPTNY